MAALNNQYVHLRGSESQREAVARIIREAAERGPGEHNANDLVVAAKIAKRAQAGGE